jgi:hypothetical protein
MRPIPFSFTLPWRPNTPQPKASRRREEVALPLSEALLILLGRNRTTTKSNISISKKIQIIRRTTTTNIRHNSTTIFINSIFSSSSSSSFNSNTIFLNGQFLNNNNNNNNIIIINISPLLTLACLSLQARLRPTCFLGIRSRVSEDQFPLPNRPFVRPIQQHRPPKPGPEFASSLKIRGAVSADMKTRRSSLDERNFSSPPEQLDHSKIEAGRRYCQYSRNLFFFICYNFMIIFQKGF